MKFERIMLLIRKSEVILVFLMRPQWYPQRACKVLSEISEQSTIASERLSWYNKNRQKFEKCFLKKIRFDDCQQTKNAGWLCLSVSETIAWNNFSCYFPTRLRRVRKRFNRKQKLSVHLWLVFSKAETFAMF